MKTPLAIFAGMVLIFGLLFVVVNYSGTGVVDQSKQNKPVEASQLVPVTYQPVGHGFAFFRPTVAEFNHNGTGAQGVLLELLQNRMAPGDGGGTGYYYLLYNHKVAKNTQQYSTLMCDLQNMLRDSHGNAYTQLSFMANGEGLVDDRIGLENQDVVGAYPGATCGFVILAVRSSGAIPDEAWAQADKLWASAEPQSADVESNAQNQPSNAVRVSYPDFSYEPSAASLRAVKFTNLEYRLDGAQIPLHEGTYNERGDNGFIDAKLGRVWYFDIRDGLPFHALVSLDVVEGSGSSTDTGYLLIFELRNGHPVITQQLAFDRQAQGSCESFDVLSSKLTVRGTSNDDSPHCCPKNLDVVSYTWKGERFEQVSAKIVPIGQ